MIQCNICLQFYNVYYRLLSESVKASLENYSLVIYHNACTLCVLKYVINTWTAVYTASVLPYSVFSRLRFCCCSYCSLDTAAVASTVLTSYFRQISWMRIFKLMKKKYFLIGIMLTIRLKSVSNFCIAFQC